MSNIRKALIWGVNVFVFTIAIMFLLCGVKTVGAIIAYVLIGGVSGFSVFATVWQMLDTEGENNNEENDEKNN